METYNHIYIAQKKCWVSEDQVQQYVDKLREVNRGSVAILHFEKEVKEEQTNTLLHFMNL